MYAVYILFFLKIHYEMDYFTALYVYDVKIEVTFPCGSCPNTLFTNFLNIQYFAHWNLLVLS